MEQSSGGGFFGFSARANTGAKNEQTSSNPEAGAT